MPSKSPAQRLRDIVDNVEAIEVFTTRMDLAVFTAAGNVYRHEYDGVDEKLIWHTVRHDLSALRDAAAAELERLRITP